MKFHGWNWHYVIKTNRGSAFVLTLLFIILLSTMSTGIYLYATKQSIYADAQYTKIAASYMSEAGLNAAKSAIIEETDIIDQLGNQNGEMDRDDFPMMLDSQVQVDVLDQNSGKTGAGSYSYVIESEIMDQIAMEFRLTRDYSYVRDNFIPNASCGDTNLHRTYSFVDCRVRLLQDGQVINTIGFDTRQNLLGNLTTTPAYPLHPQGTTNFEWVFDQVINPFSGRNYSIEMARRSLDNQDLNRYDHNKNRLYLYPNNISSCNDQPLCDSCDCKSVKIIENRIPTAPIVLPDVLYTDAFYIVHVEDPFNQSGLSIKLYYYDGSDDQELELCPKPWDTSQQHAFTLLDFQTNTDWRTPEDRNGTGFYDHGLDRNDLASRQFLITIEGLESHKWINFSISRVVPTDMKLEYRLQSETMWLNHGGSPASWFPSGTNNYKEIINLGWGEDNFGTSTEIMNDMNQLEYAHRNRLDEVYRITSIGNVERANQMRELLLTPTSFLEFSRFNQGNLPIGSGLSYGGLIYAQGRIDLRPTSIGAHVDFWGDVLTSAQFLDPHNLAIFHNSDFRTMVPFQQLPERADLIHQYTQLANNGGFFIHSSAEFCLGSYNYLGTSNQPLGFVYNDSDPNNIIARYYPPTSTIQAQDDLYPIGSSSHSGSGFTDMTSIVDGKRIFNGVIFVDGDLTIWGKLSGKSLTFVVAGNIIINREIIMGTDIQQTNSPFKNFGEGLPVHLGLISIADHLNHGNIIISQFSPRIMRVEAALMAINGTVLSEDHDVGAGPDPAPPARIDLDRSHRHYVEMPNAGGTGLIWTAMEHPIGPVDINNDGGISSYKNWNESNPSETITVGTNTFDVGQQYIWYIALVGPVLTDQPIDFGLFNTRSQTSFNNPVAGITRECLYNPTIMLNPPPHFPTTRNSLRILETTNSVHDMPTF